MKRTKSLLPAVQFEDKCIFFRFGSLDRQQMSAFDHVKVMAVDNDARSDAQLMAGLGGGDRACLAVLTHRHRERVRQLAYRMLGRWDMAEDVAQETFLRIWRAAGDYRPDARFTTWLHRVVVNLCYDAQRREYRQAVRGVEPEVEATVEADPAANLHAQDVARRVAAAVRSLPQRQRTALVLHRYQGLTHQEVAQVTGWSQSAVESLLVRAYARLRQDLADLQEN